MALTAEQKQRAAEYFEKRDKNKMTVGEYLMSRKKEALKESLLDRISSRLSERGQDIKETFSKTASGDITPLETGVRTVGDVIGGVGDIAGETLVELTPEPVKETGRKLLETETGKKGLGLLQKLSQAYSSFKDKNPRVAETLEGLGNIGSILPVLGGAKVGQTVGKSGVKGMATVVNTGGKLVEPTVDTARNIGDFTVSQITGLKPDTIKTLIEAPESFSKAELEGLRRITLAEKVKTALDKRIDDLGELGSKYDEIRKKPVVVQVPKGGYEKFLQDKFGLRVNSEGKVQTTPESRPMSKADKNAISEFLETFGNVGSMDANEFLNARQALDNIAKFGEGKTTASNAVSKELRRFHDQLGKDQIEGLADLDAQFAPEKRTLERLKKDLLDKEGNLKDAAINRIANATGKGKDQQLRRLEEIYPNIGEEVKILKSLEDVEYATGNVVGAYGRSAISSAALVTGVALGNMPIVLGAIMVNPKIIVPMLKKFGNFKNGVKIDVLIEKIQNGIKLSDKEKDIVKGAMEGFAASIGGATTLGAINQTTE